jgi:hypothetical protein
MCLGVLSRFDAHVWQDGDLAAFNEAPEGGVFVPASLLRVELLPTPGALEDDGGVLWHG